MQQETNVQRGRIGNLRRLSGMISAFLAIAVPSLLQLPGAFSASTLASPPQLPPDSGQGPSTSNTPSATVQAGQPLQGGIQKVQLTLEKLRDVGLDLKHVMTASKHLYDEVTIQPVTLITEPEVVGRGIVINIPIGTQPAGPPQPPRKDRVDLSMNEMTPVINMFKKNADDFVSGHKQLDLAPDIQTKLEPMIKDWIAQINDLSSQLNNLQPLTAGPTYDNTSIATVCTNIQKDVEQLDETRRKIYKVIRKEGDSQAAAGTVR